MSDDGINELGKLAAAVLAALVVCLFLTGVLL